MYKISRMWDVGDHRVRVNFDGQIVFLNNILLDTKGDAIAVHTICFPIAHSIDKTTREKMTLEHAKTRKMAFHQKHFVRLPHLGGSLEVTLYFYWYYLCELIIVN